jgi:hypothetical protein
MAVIQVKHVVTRVISTLQMNSFNGMSSQAYNLIVNYMITSSAL